MSKPAFVRLGPSSAKLSQELSSSPTGKSPSEIGLECAQVPHDFEPGSPVWLWLGSDNNKGQPTSWTQGIRALAYCKEKTALGGGKYSIILESVFMLPRAVEKLELLQASPETYARSLSGAAIIGLNNYSSQVVQILTEEEFATIAAIIARLLPEVRDVLFDEVDGAKDIDLIARVDAAKPTEPSAALLPTTIVVEPTIDDDDPKFKAFERLTTEDRVGGVLLVGVPGTGKSWYARQIAKKITGGDPSRYREVQFHPSYQYEDFVEGYVPDPAVGFRLVDKHLLLMIDKAEKTDGPVIIIMDEFSRTDPARVLGETMTYMEGTMRGVPFYLPSGRRITMPSNLIFLATMNPDDRSVDEIDDAMDRRWGKITLEPEADRVRDFLVANGAPTGLIGPVINFFIELQRRIPIGHAFFRSVKDKSSLERLWDMQLIHFMRKRFRFDAASLGEVNALWGDCKAALDEEPAAPADAADETGPDVT